MALERAKTHVVAAVTLHDHPGKELSHASPAIIKKDRTHSLLLIHASNGHNGWATNKWSLVIRTLGLLANESRALFNIVPWACFH
mmetsp:Transcript_15883/g.34487  ORF Transcript_15883/g.34487 Transcript_15883/m.34487 type:complete len:85 (+) Transcript_15883:636-890(+)